MLVPVWIIVSITVGSHPLLKLLLADRFFLQKINVEDIFRQLIHLVARFLNVKRFIKIKSEAPTS
jgi:hypothetical protein